MSSDDWVLTDGNIAMGEMQVLQRLMQRISVPVDMHTATCEHVAAKTLRDWLAQPEPQPFIWRSVPLWQLFLCSDCANDLGRAIQRYQLRVKSAKDDRRR